MATVAQIYAVTSFWTNTVQKKEKTTKKYQVFKIQFPHIPEPPAFSFAVFAYLYLVKKHLLSEYSLSGILSTKYWRCWSKFFWFRLNYSRFAALGQKAFYILSTVQVETWVLPWTSIIFALDHEQRSECKEVCDVLKIRWPWLILLRRCLTVVITI